MAGMSGGGSTPGLEVGGFSSAALEQLTRIADRAAGRGLTGGATGGDKGSEGLGKAVGEFGRKVDRLVGGLTARAAAITTGLAARGFSGTVEQAGMSFAMEQLGRQIAAVFSPVVQGLTWLTNRMTMRLAAASG